MFCFCFFFFCKIYEHVSGIYLGYTGIVFISKDSE